MREVFGSQSVGLSDLLCALLSVPVIVCVNVLVSICGCGCGILTFTKMKTMLQTNLRDSDEDEEDGEDYLEELIARELSRYLEKFWCSMCSAT